MMSIWTKTKLPILTRLKYWFAGIRDVIKYNLYNILYKLDILGRRVFSDSSRREVSITVFNHRVFHREVNTKLLRAIVVPKVEEVTEVSSDYFYREKNGREEIVLSVEDHYSQRYLMTVHLEGIYLKFGGKSYALNALPIVRVFSWDEKSGRKYNTFEYDLTLVRNLQAQAAVSDVSRISSAELQAVYEGLRQSMQQYVEGITLRDLEVK